jgi:hypothetical protein
MNGGSNLRGLKQQVTPLRALGIFEWDEMKGQTLNCR